MRPSLAMTLLLSLAFTLSTGLDHWYQGWEESHGGVKSVLKTVMGESQRMFSNHFVSKADAYFHSGFYPGVFEASGAFQTPHVAADAGALEEKNEEHEADFLGKPHDWIEKFGRRFYPSEHTHLDEGGAGHGTNEHSVSEVREILPWIKLATEVDPNKVEAYVVAAYWLRQRLGKPEEAERFLREGLRLNQGDPSILFELGRIYEENHQDSERARTLWMLSLKNLNKQIVSTGETNTFLLSQIYTHLIRQDMKVGNTNEVLTLFQKLKPLSPNPQQVDNWIAEYKGGMTSTMTNRNQPSSR